MFHYQNTYHSSTSCERICVTDFGKKASTYSLADQCSIINNRGVLINIFLLLLS